MTSKSPTKLLPILQWTLAAAAFEAGLVVVGLGEGPAATWGLAVAAVAVLAVVLPFKKVELGPEERDPWRVTPELAERRRRVQQRAAAALVLLPGAADGDADRPARAPARAAA